MNRFVWGLAIGTICLLATVAHARVWTDIYGNELNGTFKNFNKNNGTVTITLNGRRIPVPFSGLCRDDRDFVISEIKKKGGREEDVAPYDTEIPDRASTQNRFDRGPGVSGQPAAGNLAGGAPAAIPPAGGSAGINGPGAMPSFPTGPVAQSQPGAGGIPAAGGNSPPAGQFPGRSDFSGGSTYGETNFEPASPGTSFPQTGSTSGHSFAGSGIPGADPATRSSTPNFPAGLTGGRAAGSDAPAFNPGVSHTPPTSGGWTSPSNYPSSQSSGSSAYDSGRSAGKVIGYLLMAALSLSAIVRVYMKNN